VASAFCAAPASGRLTVRPIETFAAGDLVNGTSELRSRCAAPRPWWSIRRQPIDIIRDTLEERGLDQARAA
jgi:hypothetical protein